MRIHQLSDEIKSYSHPSRKCAGEIFRIIDNNKKLFCEYIDKDYLNSITHAFGELSSGHSSMYETEAFSREFEQHFQSLRYNLDKII